MRFKIISTGWQCADWMERTLVSIENQSVDNWDVYITYDACEDSGGEFIRKWCESRDERWHPQINTDQRFAPRNQFEAMQAAQPADDDVVVFLDLDGDQFAHVNVLKNLADYYSDGTLATYGSYVAVPRVGAPGVIQPFPEDVVRQGSYRHYTSNYGCCFNHLRTMSGRVSKSLPMEIFQWDTGDLAGQWYQGGTDYVVMLSALERAGGKYKCIPEVLVLYNHANPLADNMTHPRESDSCTRNFLNREPLLPLPEPQIQPPAHLFESLEPEDRRELLRAIGAQYGYNVFIETGTNQGLTPLFLASSFRDVYTIELHEGLWSAAAQRLSSYTNVRCLQGDSTVVLPEILRSLDEPAVVWLDGHHSGPGTAYGDHSSPIVEELAALFADNKPHIILVDDARIFDGGPEHLLYEHYFEYPALTWVEELANSNGFSYELKDDIIRLVPYALN